MRKPIVIANWKMNLSKRKGIFHAEATKGFLTKKRITCDVVLCPSLTSLNAVSEVLKRTKIKAGAQNVFNHDKGAYTGEVSASMIKESGAKYVIIGHSERRIYFGESDAVINKKIKAALKKDITPIFCIGEKLEDRVIKKTAKVLSRQIKNGLKGVDPKKVIIAYEPIWAISTFQRGKKKQPATVIDAVKAHKYIRKVLEVWHTKKASRETRIIYGGSVNAEVAKDFITQPDIDGFLVGNASLDPVSFTDIVLLYQS